MSIKTTFLFILCSQLGLSAQALPQKQSEFPRPDAYSSEQLRTHFEEVKSQLLRSEEKQRSIMSSLFLINKKMRRLVSDRSKSDQKRMMLESSTKSLASRILELETMLKDQRSLLRNRLNAIYRLGGQGLARMLFSSADSAQLERNLKILGIVAKRDLSVMKEYAASVSELTQKQRIFLARLAALKSIQTKVADQEKMISGESASKARILESIRKTKVKALAKLRKLRERGVRVGLKEDDELLDLLLKPSFFEKKGQLGMPIKGEILRKFGIWKDSQYNVSLNHKGLFFRAEPKASVNAVFSGMVAYSGEIEGFGPTLILDHGDHYYSVYSGLTEILATSGSDVRDGQKIASVSDGLYFEIRHFSEPYDPQHWMKGQHR